jgi:glycosyltransferase involved in cell wall biosynthesis
VPPRDPRALAAAIAALLSRSPAALSRLGSAARERIATQYSLAAVVERYARVYEEIAGASASARAA